MKKDPELSRGDAALISRLRTVLNHMMNAVLISNKHVEHREKYKRVVRDSVIPLAIHTIRLLNELLFCNDLAIEENVMIQDRQLNSLISFQVAFINDKRLIIDIYNEKYSIYNFEQGMVYLSKEITAPSICEELFHALQYVYRPSIDKDVAELEAFNVRRIVFPEDVPNKFAIMPESRDFKTMQLAELRPRKEDDSR